MSMKHITWLAATLLLLSACAPTPTRQTTPPAPPAAAPAPPPQSDVVVRPLEMPQLDEQPLARESDIFSEPDPAEMTQVFRPVSPAVTALVERARLQADTGELGQAAATLERALRVEPQNAALWLELAQIKLHQGNPAQAEQMALRATRFARDDVTERQAWSVAALARQNLGDPDGAAEARRRAGQ